MKCGPRSYGPNLRAGAGRDNRDGRTLDVAVDVLVVIVAIFAVEVWWIAWA
jgi:hypothetical protein